jgi:hypothetical protein
MSRRKDNLKIIEKLKDYFIENPEIRFWQGLFNLGIISGWIDDYSQCYRFDDKHHEEPDVTLKLIITNLKKQKQNSV